jgi:hypothetical protein
MMPNRTATECRQQPLIDDTTRFEWLTIRLMAERISGVQPSPPTDGNWPDAWRDVIDQAIHAEILLATAGTEQTQQLQLQQPNATCSLCNHYRPVWTTPRCVQILCAQHRAVKRGLHTCGQFER